MLLCVAQGVWRHVVGGTATTRLNLPYISTCCRLQAARDIADVRTALEDAVEESRVAEQEVARWRESADKAAHAAREEQE